MIATFPKKRFFAGEAVKVRVGRSLGSIDSFKTALSCQSKASEVHQRVLVSRC